MPSDVGSRKTSKTGKSGKLVAGELAVIVAGALASLVEGVVVITEIRRFLVANKMFVVVMNTQIV